MMRSIFYYYYMYRYYIYAKEYRHTIELDVLFRIYAKV